MAYRYETMIEQKKIWRTIYEYTKYSDFEYFTHGEAEDDIWLINRKKGIIKRVILKKETAQSTLFMVQKIMDHFNDIEDTVGHTINRFEIILVNQTNHFQDNMPNHIFIEQCNDESDLKRLFGHPYQKITGKNKDKAIKTYKKSVLNGNMIENAIRKFSPLTYLIMLLNVVIFILMSIVQHIHKVEMIIDKGGLTHFNFVHGDYYRIITSIFIHFDVQHLLYNMMTLFIFGKLVEYLYTRWQYLCIYFIGGIIGNLISLTFDNISISVGASGAICALIGALMSHLIFSGKFEKKFLIQTFIGILIFLIGSAIFENVNHYAHFGGLFGGLFIASMFFIYRYSKRYFYYMALGLVVILGLLIINIFSEREHHIYNEYAKQYLMEGKDSEGIEIIRKTIDRGYQNDETYVLYGLWKTKDEGLSSGLLVWLDALKKYPNSERLNFQLALAYRAMDDYPKAEKYIDKTITINKKEEYIKLKKEIQEFR
ncbi:MULTISPECIES: rhomboid family intramembrane serine protease [Staphylococcaceae]|uniref:rhomboid family protein n=1 Tax=Macrococcus sp. S115 TaxID=3047480 RepID=UPI001C5F08BE|nr:MULTISPECIES: rhomboid family intramembrane serine protease [Macrococcus]MDJ1111288.1 rhomboid family intramembrane serine protease [Macrococcus sp. S115]QYA32045.1 rhomboid family intramembrane serine protease [Macrococcus sp. 19Msa1099]QYA36851.1 rhomboid family intramembrane serine protease [Macrococcus caseolyticus]QYA75559.1 rhomboid family intramembrane serine protease [Macrococcus caseolyticus]